MIDNLTKAIVHAREVAENWKSQLVNCVSEEGRNMCLERASEHELLASWLEELQARIEKDRWIPITERLPDDRKDTYWVCTDGEYQCQCRWTDVNPFWTDLKTDWHWCPFDIPQYQKVTYWRSLPKAPESEATNEQ